MQLTALAQQIEELNKKLALLTADLTSAKSTLLDKDKQITDLDKKLKQAMVKKVEELADYRSEFFGKLKKALSNRPEIRVVGDRFVFQSEVLFPSASAQLEEGGKQELMKMAETLKEVANPMTPSVPSVHVEVHFKDKAELAGFQQALRASKLEVETDGNAERGFVGVVRILDCAALEFRDFLEAHIRMSLRDAWSGTGRNANSGY